MVSYTTNLSLILPGAGEFVNNWDQPINQNFASVDAQFSSTTGHTHDGSAGSGGIISHTNLSGIGTNTHAQIDTHIADAALHADTKIGTVKAELTADGPTITDVTQIIFANSVVEETATGIVKVSPKVNDPDPLLYNRPTSASISWSEAFNYDFGAKIGTENWHVAKSSVIAPEFTKSGVGAALAIPASASIKTGGVVCHSGVAIPHGAAQRVAIVVDKLNGATPSLADADEFTLSLDVLSTTAYGSPRKPSGVGLSMLIQKLEGSSTLNYQFSVQSEDTNAEVVYADFTADLGAEGSDFQGKPLSYIKGHHEFSVSRAENDEESFYLHYYLNGGLILRKFFSTGSSDAATAEFAREIVALLVTLNSQPDQPKFGRMGWSVGYTISSSSLQTFEIASVMLGSQDDLITERFVSTPQESQPIAVCASGDFSGFNVGDIFDFDGPNLTDVNWIISGKFEAGSQGINNGAGFYVTPDDGGDTKIVWCDVPSGATGSANLTSFSPAVLSVSGTNFPTGVADVTMGDIAENSMDIRITFDDLYPKFDMAPDMGTNYTANSVVPEALLGVTKVGGFVTTGSQFGSSSGDSRYELALASLSPNLAWGATFSVRFTPKYHSIFSSDYRVDLPAAVTVVPANPFGRGAEVNRLLLRHNGSSWERVGSSIQEGDTLLFAINAIGLPLGSGFWDSGNVSQIATWGVTNANAADPDNPGHLAGISTYAVAPSSVTITNSRFVPGVDLASYGGEFGFNPQVLGNPGSVDVIQPNNRFASPGLGTMLWVELQVPDDFYQSTDVTHNKEIDLFVRDPLRDTFNKRVPILNGTEVLPRIPYVTAQPDITSGGSPTDLEESTAISVDLVVAYADADVEVYYGTGWDVSEGTKATPTVTGTAASRTITVTGTLGTHAGTDDDKVQLIVRNPVAFAEEGADHEFTVLLGEVFATGGSSSDPAPAFGGGTSVALTHNVITSHSVVVTNSSPGTILAFEASGAENDFAKFSGDISYDAGTGTFTFDAYAIEPVSLSIPASVTLYAINPDGQFATTTVNITSDVAPSITAVGVNTPYAVATDNVWSLTEDGYYVDLYFTVANAITPGSPAGTLPIFSSKKVGGFAVLNPPIMFIGKPEALSTTLYKQRAIVRATQNDGDILGITITKPTLLGNKTLSGNLDTAITFQKNTVLGNTAVEALDGIPTTDPFVATRLLPSSSRARLTEDPTEFANTGVGFTGELAEGHYASFRLNGRFYPTNINGPNLDIELLDESSNVISSSLSIQAGSGGIIGSLLLNDNVAGRAVRLRLTDTTRSETVISDTFMKVTKPVRPRIQSATIDNPVGGATGATLVITGQNLVPPSPPSSQSALSYTYTVFNGGATNVFSNVTQVSATATRLEFTLDIALNADDVSYGVTIDYLGGNTVRFANLGTLQSATTGTPQVGSVQTYRSELDPAIAPAVPTALGRTGTLRIVGTGLGAQNVSNVQLEIVGEEGAALEISSGYGLSEEFSASRIDVVSIDSQTDTEIKCTVNAGPEYSNVRGRVILSRPATHPSGAGEWSQGLVDGSGLGTVNGVDNYGLVGAWGDYEKSNVINVDPTQGATQLDVARSLQGQCGAGTEGDAFSISVQLRDALTTQTPPNLISVADANGVEFENLEITKTANPFVVTITGNVPEVGVNNTYPLGAFAAGTPARPTIKLENGTIVASALLGSSDWGTGGSGISF
jgi:hypothetical protein